MKHLDKILKERVEKSDRYGLTEASIKLDAAKHILRGEDRYGRSVEIPEEDIVNNPDIIARKGDDGKYHRVTSWELLDDYLRAPISEGGLFRFPPAEVALEGQKALANPEKFPLNTYPSDDVNPSYMSKTARFFREKLGIPNVQTENVALGAGVNDLVNGLMSILSNGTESKPSIILGQKDEYHSYARIPDKWYAQMRFVDDFSKDGLEKWKKENPKESKQVVSLFFTNPVASSGKIHEREALEGIADFAKENDLFVVVDQIFATSLYDKDRDVLPAIASLPDMESRTATLWGLSKDWGAANLRQGYVAAPEEIVERLYLHTQYSVVTISKLQQVMGEKLLDIALEKDTPWLDENNEELRKRSEIIIEKSADINERIIAKLKQDAPELYNALNEHARKIRVSEVEEAFQKHDISELIHNEKCAEIKSRPDHNYLKIVDVVETPKAGHSMVLGFDDLISFGMLNRQGEPIIDNLDITGLFMEHGLPMSPLYPTANDSSQIRFSYSQFGDLATQVPYLKDLMAKQQEWMGEALNIKVDSIPTSQESLESYAKLQGIKIDPEHFAIDSYEEAYEEGKDILRNALDKMGEALEEMVFSQEKWKGRAPKEERAAATWEDAIARSFSGQITPLGRLY